MSGPAAGTLITMTDEQIAQMQMNQEIGAQLTAWEGYGVLVAWVVVVLAAAALLLKKRDA